MGPEEYSEYFEVTFLTATWSTGKRTIIQAYRDRENGEIPLLPRNCERVARSQ